MTWENPGHQPHPWKAATCCHSCSRHKVQNGQNQYMWSRGGTFLVPLPLQSTLAGSGQPWNVKSMERTATDWQDGPHTLPCANRPLAGEILLLPSLE